MARFKGRKNNLSVLQAYAPTADSSDEDLEEFYDQVEEGLTKMPNRDLCVVTGDWNAKIGNNNAGWEHVIGQFGIGERNERGERLLHKKRACIYAIRSIRASHPGSGHGHHQMAEIKT